MHPLGHLQVFAAGADDILDYRPQPKSLLIRIIDDDVTYHPMEYIDEYESVFEIHVMDIDLTEYDKDYSEQLRVMFNNQLFKPEHANQFHTDNMIGLKNMYYYIKNAQNAGVLPNLISVSPRKYVVVNRAETVHPYFNAI